MLNKSSANSHTQPKNGANSQTKKNDRRSTNALATHHKLQGFSLAEAEAAALFVLLYCCCQHLYFFTAAADAAGASLAEAEAAADSIEIGNKDQQNQKQTQ